MAEEEGEITKVVLVGDAGVGKTCIISQFTENKFDPETVSSLTTQFKKIFKVPQEGHLAQRHVYTEIIKF